MDATTWLNGKIRGVRYTGPNLFALDQYTWSPVNPPQNTSEVRGLIPAYVFVTMAWPTPDGTLDRYGNVCGGYVLLGLMQGTHYHAAFGRPLVEHVEKSA